MDCRMNLALASVLLLLASPVGAANTVLSGEFDGSEPTTAGLPGTCDDAGELAYREIGPVRVSESGTQPRLIPDNRLTMQPPVRRYADERPDRISLKPFLEEEIRQGLVTVDEDRPDYILVRVPGENLFASGQETVSSQYVPIINRIGEELTRTRGRIKVTGHTDSVPMREPGPFEVRRFPSNRSLSQARAEEVVKILAAHVDATRLSAIGMADEAPLPGTSGAEPENRRVEIQVLERRKGG